MTKRTLTIAATLLLAASAFAVPAKRVKRQVEQPDGTMLTVTVRGDENFHFVATEDGQPLVVGNDGAYRYAVLDADGHLAPSSQVAHNLSGRSAAEKAFLSSYSTEASKVRSLGEKRAAQRNSRRIARLMKRGAVDSKGMPRRQQMAGATGGEGIGVTGERKGLVILVNFKDKKMQSKHTQAEWNDYFNKVGYDINGNSGSVHDYFYEQSYGKFDLDFDVVGPVTVSKNMAAYGANDASGDDIDPAGMVVEACKLAYDQYGLDMSKYDWDGDGAVDQVYLIYAGYGEASDATGELADCIWQHEWDIQEGGYSLVLGGKRIRTYGCSSELNGNAGTQMDGIGTACHEFSHCLGIPDFYDTGGNNNYGMSEWDLMDYGSYGGDGYCPSGYNTYEKWVSGWIEPTVLSKPQYITDMKPLTDAPEACVVFNEATPTEYYIFENRQQKKTDAELPAHGMLVIHVDYDQTAWTKNTVNNVYNHQRFTIVPADNKLTESTNSGDTYPGTTKTTSLTDNTTPATKLFNANSDGRKFLGKPVTDIKESNGNISFTFMGGISIDTPSDDDINVTDMGSNWFSAAWAPIADAKSYNLELREKSEQPSADEALLLSESLKTWGKDAVSDGTKDISADLDSYMTNKGWTGTKVYECPGCAKLGSSKAVGNLTSPLITDHEASVVTVRLSSSAYGNDAAETKVALVDADGNELSSETIAPDGKMATIQLANDNSVDYKVVITPKKRGYVYSVAIYDGEYSAEDFISQNVAPKSVMRAATQRFSDVKDCKYRFENLNEGATYQWRLQAVSGNVLSAWSNWQTVDLGAYTSINGVNEDASLKANDEVEVFTATGVCCGRMTLGEFAASQLPSGVYVVKNGGKSLKLAK